MAAFMHFGNRPLKRPRLGAPDVYPQDPKQKEDELTATNVKQGFNNQPAFASDEYGSARSSHINPNKFGACFSTLVAEKQKVNTFQDSGKKKIQISKDNYYPITQTSKSKAVLQAWFQDLAGSKPLPYLAKRVPLFNKKDDIFVTLYDYGVPMTRATWFLKMTAAHSAAMSETKIKKRAPNDPSLDWCQMLTKFLRDQLTKIVEYHHTLAATQSATMSGLGSLAAPSSLPLEIEHAFNLWQYNCRLARYLYQEGMLECHEFLSWLVEITEKVKQHDDNTFRIVLPFNLQFLEEFVRSQMLSRRLAYMCVRRLTAIINDATCATNPPTPSPHMVTSPTSVSMPSSQPTPQPALAAIFAEYTSCPQHRPIVVGLSLILQTVALRCPSALVWINIGEGKSLSAPGSPLDILPCAPSSLPLPGPPSIQNHHIRASIRNAEHQIKMRSRAAEVRWSSDKCQESTTDTKMAALCYQGDNPNITMYNCRGHTISRVLHVLELLDRHCFDRCDSTNCLDSLYNKIFNTPPNKDGSDMPLSDDPIILLLCEWAVCSERSGEHRALVVAQLLEKRVIDLESEKAEPDLLEEKESLSTVSLMPGAMPMLQGLLTHFLDTQAPVYVDENGPIEDRRAFASLVLLFSELIRCDVFSHDSYMCTLISRGDLTTSPLPSANSEPPPSSERMEVDPEKRTPSEIKEEPKDMDGIGIKQEQEEKEEYDDSDEDTKPSGIHKKESVSFQEKFLEALQSNKLSTEDSFFEDDKDERKKALREGGTPSPHPPPPKPNRHLMYATHFPLPQDEMSAHECNQRLVLLYGFGKARDEARHTARRIQRETLRALGSKKETTPGKSDSKAKHVKSEGQPVSFEHVLERYRTLSYFDQHAVTAACASHVLEQVQSCTQGSLDNLPSVEQITLVFELMENALNIHALLEFSVQLLNYMSIVEAELTQKSSPLAGNYTPNLCLSIVAVLRRYQACLLVSQEQTATVFELLCGIVKHVTNVTVCSSAERCILAYLYELYTSCSHVKAKFSDMFSSVASKVKQTLYTSVHPSESNPLWNPKFMQEYIQNPRDLQFHHTSLGKQLNESSTDRYSFVCNVLLYICSPTDVQMLNDLSIMCAELTSCCSALSSEWLGVLKALCCSSNPSCGFNDILCQVDVNDLSIHDSVAVFAAILIARHCFALEDVVEHVALTSLLDFTTPSLNAGTQMESDAEPGARLMCRLLLRLLSTGPLPGQSDKNGYYVKSSCDQHLLAAAHRSISVEALVGVLKAILLLGEAGVGGGTSGSFDDFTEDPRSSGSIETASLSDYAKFTLKTICSQSWVREIFLKDPDRLWTREVLLDQVLSHKHAHYLVQLICYPNGVPLISDGSYESEQKQAITRILRNLDQWTLRVSWLELQLMLKQCANSEMNPLLDNIAKATIEVFQQQHSDEGSAATKSAPGGQNGQRKAVQQIRLEQERSGVWLVAPLISKLSSQVQGRVLRAAGNVLESVGHTWSKSSKDKDKHGHKAQMSLVSHQPLLSLVLTCLKGQDEQREGLLTSLQTQLTQFLQSPKDDRWEDEQSRRMMHEALQLRLSLVGNMFDTILRSQQWTTEFALLLLQLITTGTVDTHSNSELFTTVLDMLSVLINSTLSSDCSEGEKGREHQTLIKKLKKELGDKHSYDIDRVRQLLPVPKKTCDVVTVEPMGSLIDTKGNKIAGFDSINKKQGLQVASKQKINPWDTLEAYKNPAPLSWSFFGAVRMERKPLKYQEQFRLTHYHTHHRERPDDYYFQPPQLPPDEEEPAPPPASGPEAEKAATDSSGNSLSESGKGEGSGSGSTAGAGDITSGATTSKKRKRVRKKTPTPGQQMMREPFAYNQNMGGFPERPFMQQQQNYMPGQFPYQQPLPPAGPSRMDRQMPMGGNSKAALRNMLVDRKQPGNQREEVHYGSPILKYHLMQKQQQMAHYKQQQAARAMGGSGVSTDMFMQYKGPHEGPMHHMQPGQPQAPSSVGYGGYGNQMMQQPQLTNDPMVSPNYSHYSAHGAQPTVGPGGMMGPQMGRPQVQPGQSGYMSQHRQVPEAVSRLQHQLQQRASMQRGMAPGNIMPQHQPTAPHSGGQPYMQPLAAPQERQHQVLRQQRLAVLQKQQQQQQQQHQPPQHHQQDQQTANLVSRLKSQMTQSGPGSMGPAQAMQQQPPPQYNPYQQQY